MGRAEQEQEAPEGREVARWAEFGRYLERLRKELGLKPAEVVERSGKAISAQTLWVLERGGQRHYEGEELVLPNPYDETLYALANVYGAHPGERQRLADEMFAQVGHHRDRLRTKNNPRRAQGSKKRMARLDELEARDQARQEEMADMLARLQALEARFPKRGDAEPATRRRSRRSPAS